MENLLTSKENIGQPYSLEKKSKPGRLNQEKPEKTRKTGFMENPRKVTSSPRVAQHKHMTQARDWKAVTSNDDNTYVNSRAKTNKT